MSRSLAELAANIASPATGAVAICEHALARIAETNEIYGALSDVLSATALESARQLDANIAEGLDAGCLAGTIIAAKDCISTAEGRCSAGLSFLENHKPGFDADVIRRLKSEGATLIGMAATDSGMFGVTTPAVTNPVYPDRIAGGSSGGAAAAVAAGFCHVAIGTDTGGSIRIPAACCGVVGFKPSKGRVSLEGVRPLSLTADHVGPIARTVADIRAVMEVIDPRFEDLPRAKEIQTSVIGIPEDFFKDADAAVVAMLNEAIAACKHMGFRIETVDLPPAAKIADSHLILSLGEAALVAAQEGRDFGEYPQVARDSLALVQSFSVTDVKRAYQDIDEFNCRLSDVFEKVDYILSPTLPISPPSKGGDENLLKSLIRYTCPFNQSGSPAIAIPWVSDASDYIGSIQIIADLNNDRNLIDFSEFFQKFNSNHR